MSHPSLGGGDGGHTSPTTSSIHHSMAATTISSVAVQSGTSRVVIAVLRSGRWIRVKIQQMEPDLLDVGANILECKKRRQEHDDLVTKLQSKQDSVLSLLSQADPLGGAGEGKEVYDAMAQSLGEAWRDLNRQLEQRKTILELAEKMHEETEMFESNITTAEHVLHSSQPPQDVESAKVQLKQHEDIRKSISERSDSALSASLALVKQMRDVGGRVMWDHHHHRQGMDET